MKFTFAHALMAGGAEPPACACDVPGAPSTPPPHRLAGNVEVGELSAREVRPYVPLAMTRDARDLARVGANLAAPARERLQALVESGLAELVRGHDGVEPFFAVRFACAPGARTVVSQVQPADWPQVVIFWGLEDPRPQPPLPAKRQPRERRRRLHFRREQLELEDAPVAGERRLRLDPPEARSGREAQTFRELFQGYPGVARRPEPRTRPFDALVAVGLPGDASAERVGGTYRVAGDLCRLPVPTRSVRLVHLGYEAPEATPEPAPLHEEIECEDLVELAGLELFTEAERAAVSGGERAAAFEAIAHALDRGDQLQALALVLLQLREAEVWERGTAEERRALHRAAYARLRALLRVLPADLIERQRGETPERVTANFERSLAGLRISVGGGG